MIKSVLILALFLVSCDLFYTNDDKFMVFASNIKQKVYKVKNANIVGPSILNTNKEINRPFYTQKNLVLFENYMALSYKIPSRGKQNGVLKLFNLKSDKVYAKLEGVSALKVFLFWEKNKLMKSLRGIKPLHLYLIFNQSFKKRKIVIPLYNLSSKDIFIKGEKNQNAISYKKIKYSSSLVLSPIPGMKFSRKLRPINLIGALDDSYLDSRFSFCHRVNKNCEDIKENVCNLCRFGYYGVVDFSCPKGGSKVCGINRCGEKGMPACVRGVSFSRRLQNTAELCFDGSRAGFCRPGLSTVCDGRKILICL